MISWKVTTGRRRIVIISSKKMDLLIELHSGDTRVHSLDHLLGDDHRVDMLR